MGHGVTLMGGLGNQIFQLAFSMYLDRVGVNVSYIVTDYSSDTFGRCVEIDGIFSNKALIHIARGLYVRST